jgi:hypothetical protein
VLFKQGVIALCGSTSSHHNIAGASGVFQNVVISQSLTLNAGTTVNFTGSTLFFAAINGNTLSVNNLYINQQLIAPGASVTVLTITGSTAVFTNLSVGGTLFATNLSTPSYSLQLNDMGQGSTFATTDFATPYTFSATTGVSAMNWPTPSFPTSNITFPRLGWYQVTYSMPWDGMTVGNADLSLVNGQLTVIF